MLIPSRCELRPELGERYLVGRPERVGGIPIAREILDLAAEIPSSRFQRNPPRLTPLSPSVCERTADYRASGRIR